MPRDASAESLAVAKQRQAAHETGAPVLLVAGPGSGKSATIEERVSHLVQGGVSPASIFAISFTNASALDLRRRVEQALTNVVLSPSGPSVSTLHSLALRSLRSGGLINVYPADPLVLDGWETRRLIDEEFVAMHSVSLTRTREIRAYHEAMMSTGSSAPANYVAPSSPVTSAEANSFSAFTQRRRTLYACVLPGEIVLDCVRHIAAGALDPVALLSIEHLIVDEFQDLNPVDIQFVDALIASGANCFVAGDDDQSIYSFRYGSPAGMQNFPRKYGTCVVHKLEDCFRCTPVVLDTAQTLIAAYSMPARLPKVHRSLYTGSIPPVPGVVHRWRFRGASTEAKSIADSCASLIASGLPPSEILILLLNQRVQAKVLYEAMDTASVPFKPARQLGPRDTDEGRLCLATLRAICDPDDYVSRRTILGLRPRTGSKTCADIANRALAANVMPANLFRARLPTDVFTTRQTKALTDVAALLTLLEPLTDTDTLAQASATIATALSAYSPSAASTMWTDLTAELSIDMTLREMRDFIWADNDEQQAEIVANVYARLGQTPSASNLLPARVRVMSLHGAKGLSASVVFVPGLEEQLLPGSNAGRSAGGIYEAARLLYVAITRAKSACFLSYVDRRGVQGRSRAQVVTRFGPHLGGPFIRRSSGIIPQETQEIINNHLLL